MATFTKRGDAWRAQVRIKDHPPQSASFQTKAQAQAWAVATEADIRAMRRGEIPDKTVRELLTRYAEEASPLRRGGRWEQKRLFALCRDDRLADVRLRKIRASDMAAWRDRRLAVVQPASVLREWNLISAAFTYSVKNWGWLHDNPLKGVARPEAPRPRSRRAGAGELERIYHALGYAPGQTPATLTATVGAAAAFAIETGMRAGEIVALTWEHVDLARKVAHLPMTKNGNSRDVPLSSAATSILATLARGDPGSGPVFGVASDSLSTLWRKGAARAAVSGLRFHDLRREALSRLSRKVDVLTLAKISGHKDLRILLNTYYSVDMADVAEALG